MPPKPGPDPLQNTPLAPSVEKAYYRKCIELKRRLNEVEDANNAARLRKLRLNRAIMKMRLERAFLLDEMAKRLGHAESNGGEGKNGDTVGEEKEEPEREREGERGESGQGD